MGQFDRIGDDFENQRGIFGSDCAGLCDALGDHDSQRKQATNEGLAVTFACSRCGANKAMIVEWPELIAMRFGIPPAFAYQQRPQGLMQGAPLDWKWDAQDQVWWPAMPCSSCQRPLIVTLSPVDIAQSVDAAKARGFIHPQVEQVCAQLCSGASQALRAQQMRR